MQCNILYFVYAFFYHVTGLFTNRYNLAHNKAGWENFLLILIVHATTNITLYVKFNINAVDMYTIQINLLMNSMTMHHHDERHAYI